MKSRSLAILTFSLLSLVAGPAGAKSHGTVAIRILEEPIENLRAYAEEVLSASLRTAPAAALAGRSAATSDVLLVPYYESDRKDPNGVNTLFAVRNETDRELPVRILYVGVLGAVEQQVQEISLPANALRTVNLRDVPGLPADADGVARGLVILGVIGHDGESSDLLSGDFFVVDPATDFATGNTMLNMSLDDSGNEFCAEWGSRFFHGGAFSGNSTFRFVVDEAAGGTEIDPPTAVGTVYDEGGVALSSFEIRTDLNSFELSSGQIVPGGAAFGSVSIRFPATQGALLVEHSGFHRLSVAFKAACRDSVEVE
jgi:hypothetical protein